jgi:hypothetical protein
LYGVGFYWFVGEILIKEDRRALVVVFFIGAKKTAALPGSDDKMGA